MLDGAAYQLPFYANQQDFNAGNATLSATVPN
jgi:hypothetical protein